MDTKINTLSNNVKSTPSLKLNNKYTDYKNERPKSSDSRLSLKSGPKTETA